MIDYTLQDLLNKHHNKINELIENVKQQNKLIEGLKVEGIKEEVISELINYLNNKFKIDGGIF